MFTLLFNLIIIHINDDKSMGFGGDCNIGFAAAVNPKP